MYQNVFHNAHQFSYNRNMIVLRHLELLNCYINCDNWTL